MVQNSVEVDTATKQDSYDLVPYVKPISATKPTTLYSIFKKKTQVQKIEILPPSDIEEMNSTDQRDEELNATLKEADYQKWLKNHTTNVRCLTEKCDCIIKNMNKLNV